MKEEIRNLIEDALPLVDLDSDFLFTDLDSLGITSIMMILSEHYDIPLEHKDATPRNFKNLESLAQMVHKKLEEKG